MHLHSVATGRHTTLHSYSCMDVVPTGWARGFCHHQSHLRQQALVQAEAPALTDQVKNPALFENLMTLATLLLGCHASRYGIFYSCRSCDLCIALLGSIARAA